MNLKKFISGVSALTIAASAFAGMAVTASAEEIDATLVYTAHASSGMNNTSGYYDTSVHGSYGDIVDGREYFNNDQTRSNTYNGWAFAKFSFTIPAGHTITNAKLTWSGTAGKYYNSNLYYLNSGKDLTISDLDDGAAHNAQFNGEKTKIADVADLRTDNLNREVNVTDQVIALKNQGYIVFQWTGHAGGAYLYGKNSEYKPTLKITTTEEIRYTATFTETNNVVNTVNIYSDSARTTGVTNGTLATGTTYYYTATAAGYEDYQGQFTVGNQAPEVSFTMTHKAAAGKIKVYYKDTNDNEIADPVEFSGTYVGESTRYTAPKYIVNGSKLYEKNDTTYAYTETAVAADKDADTTMVYTASGTGTYQFIDVSGSETWSQYSGGSAAKGIGGNQARTSSTTFTVAESGVYTITASSDETVRIVNTTSTSNTSWNIPADQIVASIPKGSSATGVELTAGTTLYIIANGSNNWVDYVLLTKTDELPDPTEEKAYTFDDINMSTLQGIVTVTVDGVSKSGELPEAIKNYIGDLKLAIIITDIPEGAAVTTVIE